MDSKKTIFQKAQVGIDVGNGYVNYFNAEGEGEKFKTTVLQIENADLIQPSEEVHIVEVFDQMYVVGVDNGTYVETQNIQDRISSKEYKVALLTALALSLDHDLSHYYNVSLCVGLPFNLRNSFQEKLIQEIKSITANSKSDSIEFKVDGKYYQIKFDDVKVFFEGAEAIIKHKKYSEMNLLIDLGSGTTDFLLSNGKQPLKGGTVYTAMNEVLNNVYSEKQKLGKNIKREYAIKYINDQDVTHVVADTVKKIYREVTDLVTAEYMNLVDEVVLIGGGAMGTEKHLRELFKDKKCTLVDNAQFSNVTIYQAYIQR